MRSFIVVVALLLAFCLGSWAGSPNYTGYGCDGGNPSEPLYAYEESAFPLCERIERS